MIPAFRVRQSRDLQALLRLVKPEYKKARGRKVSKRLKTKEKYVTYQALEP